MTGPPIQVEGAKELRRALRKIESKEIKDAIKKANKGTSSIIAEEAEKRVPRKSGNLKRSIGARGSVASASVKAGTASKVPYAGLIHFGWGRRNIRPQPFLTDAVSDKIGEARAVYEDLLLEVYKAIDSSGLLR